MEVPPKYFKVSQHCANVYVVSWIDVTENRHVGRRSHLRPKDTLAEVTFPSHTAAEYIEHAQLLAMDYSNMLTAVAVRKQIEGLNRFYITHQNLSLVHYISLSVQKALCAFGYTEEMLSNILNPLPIYPRTKYCAMHCILLTFFAVFFYYCSELSPQNILRFLYLH